MTEDRGHFLVINKENGGLSVCTLDEPVKKYDPAGRIAQAKEMIASTEVPALCYEPEPYGKSGNMALPFGCTFCPFKRYCYPELRAFKYAGGRVVEFSKIVREPNVEEVDPR